MRFKKKQNDFLYPLNVGEELLIEIIVVSVK